MVTKKLFTFTQEVMCDHPRCRAVHCFQAESNLPGTLILDVALARKEAGWLTENPTNWTKNAKVKHYCPTHAAEHTEEPGTWNRI